MRLTLGVALGLAVWLIATLPAGALDLYFLRHAQTMANVTRDYSEANQRQFSERGLEQVAAVPAELAGLEFDVIVVSPAWRALHTIGPYLVAQGKSAEIWPEVYECCWDRQSPDEAPQLVEAELIEIPAAYADVLDFRSPEAVRFYDVDTPGRGALMIERALTLLEERFGGTEQRVLVVAHYHTISRLIGGLLGDAAPRRIRPANAKLSHLRQTADGGYLLLRLNGRAVGSAPAEPAAAPRD